MQVILEHQVEEFKFFNDENFKRVGLNFAPQYYAKKINYASYALNSKMKVLYLCKR